MKIQYSSNITYRRAVIVVAAVLLTILVAILCWLSIKKWKFSLVDALSGVARYRHDDQQLHDATRLIAIGGLIEEGHVCSALVTTGSYDYVEESFLDEIENVDDLVSGIVERGAVVAIDGDMGQLSGVDSSQLVNTCSARERGIDLSFSGTVTVSGKKYGIIGGVCRQGRWCYIRMRRVRTG